MKTPHRRFLLPCPAPLRTITLRLLAVCAAFSLAAIELSAQPGGGGGTISGAVSNAGTGDLLEGVRVTLPDLGLTAFSDHTGRYLFSNVPPGTHAVVATYTGLD